MSKVLTKADLKDLDKELDSYIPIKTLANFNVDTIVIHLLYLCETGEKSGLLEMLDNAALDIAVRWSYRYCKKANARKIHSKFDLEVFKLCLDLYHAARHYRAISDIMYLLFKEMLLGIRSENFIETKINSSFDVGMTAAQNFLFGSDDPSYELPDNSDIAKHYSECNLRRVGPMKVEYTFSNNLYQSVLRLHTKISNEFWLLDPEFNLGEYTLGELKHFSDCLAAFGQIHHSCNAGVPSQNLSLSKVAFDNLIKIDTKENWIDFFENLSGLKHSKVFQIVSDLTFDEKDEKPIPDLVSTPFIPMTKQLLAFGNRLAFSSSTERNYWKLLSIRKPAIQNHLSSGKEQIQLERIKKYLSSAKHSSLILIPRIKVGKKTDLDLLILDPGDKFGLAIQLKYPNGPAFFRETYLVLNEFQKGIEKLEITLPWLRSIPQVLQQKSDLSEENLRSFRFEALLLSANSIGLGWSNYRKDIPISSERFFKWALSDKETSVRKFWEMSGNYVYKPIEGTHFNIKTIKPAFGDIVFSAPIAYSTLKDYDPINEIDWDS